MTARGRVRSVLWPTGNKTDCLLSNKPWITPTLKASLALAFHKPVDAGCSGYPAVTLLFPTPASSRTAHFFSQKPSFTLYTYIESRHGIHPLNSPRLAVAFSSLPGAGVGNHGGQTGLPPVVAVGPGHGILRDVFAAWLNLSDRVRPNLGGLAAASSVAKLVADGARNLAP